MVILENEPLILLVVLGNNMWSALIFSINSKPSINSIFGNLSSKVLACNSFIGPLILVMGL